MTPPKIYTLLLTNKSYSPNFNSCIFTYRSEDTLVFQNGQFLQFQLPIHDQIIKRSYSIMSSFQHFLTTKEIDIFVKRVPQGIGSNWFFDTHTLGDSIQAVGPLGHLIPMSHFDRYFLIGTGSGIAPLISIYQGLPSHTTKRIIRGERTSGDLLEKITNSIGKDAIVLSQEDHIDYAQGHVQDILINSFDQYASKEGMGVYLCGKPAMVDDVKQRLIHLGVSSNHIKDEKY